jgi:hypothetical protein
VVPGSVAAAYELAVIALLLLLAGEPDVVPLDAGEKAPFTGFLFPPGRAETLGAQLEACEFERDLDKRLLTDTLTLKTQALEARLALQADAASAKEQLLREALEDAQEASRRELWERPEVLLGVGVLGGVAATVGGVYLLGVLRPLIPAE